MWKLVIKNQIDLDISDAAKLIIVSASEHFENPIDFTAPNLVDGDWTSFQRGDSCYHSGDPDKDSHVLFRLDSPAVVTMVKWQLRRDQYDSGLGCMVLLLIFLELFKPLPTVQKFHRVGTKSSWKSNRVDLNGSDSRKTKPITTESYGTFYSKIEEEIKSP